MQAAQVRRRRLSSRQAILLYGFAYGIGIGLWLLLGGLRYAPIVVAAAGVGVLIEVLNQRKAGPRPRWLRALGGVNGLLLFFAVLILAYLLL